VRCRESALTLNPSLPKERDFDSLAPFSLGRRAGEGLPHFVRRADRVYN